MAHLVYCTRHVKFHYIKYQRKTYQCIGYEERIIVFYLEFTGFGVQIRNDVIRFTVSDVIHIYVSGDTCV